MTQKILVDNQLCSAGKIVCVGRNYVDHIHELDNEVPQRMVIFCKPNSAITDTLLAEHQEPLHYEAELSFLIQNGKMSAVGMGLDLTKRNIQSELKAQSLPWERAKAFNGSALFSPFITINQVNPGLSVELGIDDDIVQSGGIELMIHKPDAILQEIQSFITLNDGDIIMTGTPKGVGQVIAGKTYHGRVKLDDSTLTEAVWVAR